MINDLLCRPLKKIGENLRRLEEESTIDQSFFDEFLMLNILSYFLQFIMNLQVAF